MHMDGMTRARLCVCLVSVHPTLKRKGGNAPAPSRRRPLPPCLIEGERGKRRKLWLEAADETTGRAASGASSFLLQQAVACRSFQMEGDDERTTPEASPGDATGGVTLQAAPPS